MCDDEDEDENENCEWMTVSDEKKICQRCGKESNCFIRYPDKTEQCSKCDEHATCLDRIADLAAQLAAEASAVEASRIAEMLSKGVEIRFSQIEHGVWAAVFDDNNGALLYTKTGATFAAALAALVQAEEKEEGK